MSFLGEHNVRTLTGDVRDARYLPTTRVVAHLTLERFMVRVDVKMVSQTLLVRVLMTTNVALMRFGLTVGSLVASHGRSCMGAEATGVAHERSLVGVFEPLVFIKGSLLHSSIVAVTALESHGGLLGMFSHDMVLQHMLIKIKLVH